VIATLDDPVARYARRPMRTAAVIFSDDRVAFIERRRASETYFLFPGGQVEPSETPEECIAREILEELGLEVRVDRLVARVIYDTRSQLYFAASVTGGTFGTGVGEEYAADIATHGIYIPRWIAVAELARIPVHPQALVPVVVEAHATGRWPEIVPTLHDTGRRPATPRPEPA
jgi:8-oxo-dGTP pyrophosphatase MutT (NUDIX family)